MREEIKRFKFCLFAAICFFNSQIASPQKPVSIPAFTGYAWQLGLAHCLKGGRIRLILPSALAYGMRSRSEKFPPNSILLFEIEVLDPKNKVQ
jgi:hypothetical protein